jgi:hypothetical protein
MMLIVRPRLKRNVITHAAPRAAGCGHPVLLLSFFIGRQICQIDAGDKSNGVADRRSIDIVLGVAGSNDGGTARRTSRIDRSANADIEYMGHVFLAKRGRKGCPGSNLSDSGSEDIEVLSSITAIV